MNIDSLKAQQAEVAKSAQDLINEQLRLEGEYRRLDILIKDMEGEPVPVTVKEPEDGELTQTS